MPSSPGDPRRWIANVLQRGWGKYQEALPEWATQDYELLPDIGGGFTDTFPNAGGAAVEGLYNTARDLTSINPSVDVPLGIAALGTGGASLLAGRGARHLDDAARAYRGTRPIRGSQGIPHTSSLPNRGPQPQLDPRGGFGDNASGTIRGDVDLSPPRNDFNDMGRLDEPADTGQTVGQMMDEDAMLGAPGLDPDWPRTWSIDEIGELQYSDPELFDEFLTWQRNGNVHPDMVDPRMNNLNEQFRGDQNPNAGRPGYGETLAENGGEVYGPGHMDPPPQTRPAHWPEPYPRDWGRSVDMPATDARRGDLGDNLNEPIHGEFWEPQHPEDFPSDDMSWMDQNSTYSDPTRQRADNSLHEINRRQNIPEENYYGGDQDVPVISPQADGQIMQAFEDLLNSGVSEDEAIEIIALQFGDLF